MTYTLQSQKFAEIRPEILAIEGATLVDTTFVELTTLHLGGRPIAAVSCQDASAIAQVVQLLDAHHIPLLVVGGGSNLVVQDGDVSLVAVILDTKNISIDASSGVVTVDAGAVWDDVVAECVTAGLGGIECLSGIPGSAGATPVQNVGAYGVEIAEVLTEVLLYDRESGETAWHPASSLDLRYRYSNLKFTERAVVLAIRLQLRTDGLSAPLRFGELARALGVTADEVDARRDPAEVREAVLALRRGKGMVFDESDHDTWSAGSFFTNPIVPEEQVAAVRERVAALHGAEVAENMPAFAAGEGQVKLSAAWLIDRAGFSKGYPTEDAPVRLSTKHTLALTNRGGASTADLVALAQDVRDGVLKVFGVELVPEPVWVGAQLNRAPR